MTSSSAFQGSSRPNTSQCHPLRLLDDDEIRTASSVLLQHIQQLDGNSGKRTKVHFKSVSLHDPAKALLFPHLEAEAAGIPYTQRPYVPRCVDIIWSTDSQRKVTESTVSLDTKTVVEQTHTNRGQHGPNDR